MADHEDYLPGEAPTAHAPTHEHAGTDEISLDSLLGTPAALAIHALLPTVHQDAPDLISTHKGDASAHHSKYTDANARAAAVEDDAYGPDWDGDTTHAPSQNSVYDEMQTRFDKNGNNTQADGKYIATDKIRARNGAGLFLEDDDGNGIEVTDDGTIHMATQSGCSAYLSTEQDIPHGTVTLVQFDQQEDDIQNELNLTTHTFTVDKDGTYQVSTLIKYNEQIDDTKYLEIMIKKNGAYYARVHHMHSDGGKGGASISLRMPLVATDTIQIWTIHNNGDARKLNTTYCRFSIAKIA